MALGAHRKGEAGVLAQAPESERVDWTARGTRKRARARELWLVFEALGLIVLFLIYFSTIIDLIRKLRIFVLEETKLEGRLVRI